MPTSVEDPRWMQAWDWLARRYAPAMRRYVYDLLRRWRGGRPDFYEAEDIVQSYFVSAMERGWLSRGPGKIRKFRAWLQTQLWRFTRDHLRACRALKRGGGVSHQCEGIEDIADVAWDPSTQQLERGFVEVAIQRAYRKLKCTNPRYACVIHGLLLKAEGGERVLEADARGGEAVPENADTRCRARHRFGELLVDELRRTVADKEALAEEWALVRAYLPWLGTDAFL